MFFTIAAGDYTLCVLDHDGIEGRNVKSYLIRRAEVGGNYYIYDEYQFHTLKDLVKHYSSKSLIIIN